MSWYYAKRIIFSTALLLLAILLLDLGVGAMGLADEQLKIQIFTDDDEGHCYSSDPRDVFPIDLERPRDRSEFTRKVRTYRHTTTAEARLLPVDVEYLRRHAPDCVLYDRRRRRHGFSPGRARRVALLGDSFTQGEGMRDQETLGYLLGQHYRAVNFQTLGIPGGGIGVLMVALQDYLRNPDAARSVIYFYNLNDARARDGVDHSTFCAGDVMEMKPDLLHTLANRSNLAYLIHRQRWQRARTERITGCFLSAYQDARNRWYVQETFKILGIMNRMVRASGGKLHVVVYPVPYRVDGVYAFEPIHRMVMERCERAGARCIDGLAAFSQERSWARLRVHPTDSHPNGEANRLMVKLLAQKLKLP